MERAPTTVERGEGLHAALAVTCRPLAEARTLPRRVYIDPEIFALEGRALFGRMWLCVGREEDLPDAGSYLTQAIGGERILVVRGEDRALRRAAPDRARPGAGCTLPPRSAWRTRGRCLWSHPL